MSKMKVLVKMLRKMPNPVCSTFIYGTDLHIYNGIGGYRNHSNFFGYGP